MQIIRVFSDDVEKKVKKSKKSFGGNKKVSIFAIPKRWVTEGKTSGKKFFDLLASSKQNNR